MAQDPQKERPMFRVLRTQIPGVIQDQKNIEKQMKAIINYYETCAKAATKLVAELKKFEKKAVPIARKPIVKK